MFLALCCRCCLAAIWVPLLSVQRLFGVVEYSGQIEWGLYMQTGVGGVGVDAFVNCEGERQKNKK